MLRVFLCWLWHIDNFIVNALNFVRWGEMKIWWKAFWNWRECSSSACCACSQAGWPLMLRCSQDPCCSGSNRRTTALCLLALLVTRSGVCTSLGRSCPLSPARQNLPLWDWVGFELKLLCCGWMSHVQSWALWQGIESSSSLPEIPRFWSCPSGADVGLQLWQNVKWRHGGFLWEPEELGGGKQKSN